jgi:hypothetical protein
MAKLRRVKDEPTGLEINLDTGEISAPEAKPWSVQTMASFARCVNLVEQITEGKINVIDETNITTVAYSLVEFQEKGYSLFTQVCLFQNLFDTEFLKNLWEEALRKSKRKSGSFLKLCKEKGLQAVISEDEAWAYMLKEPGKGRRDIGSELTEADLECIREYHHLEYNNCYYFASYERDELGNPKNCVLERKSNFVLQILYHIQRGKVNKRVVVLKNNRNREVTLDIETDQITSFQKFKSVTEGAGNFLFEGSQVDLNKIKNKLFEQEKPCLQIDTLGYHKKAGFFTFNNGIYNAQFRPVDKYGIVTYEEVNYYIPYHPEGEESMFLNEKKFSFKDSAVTWSQWAPLYHKAFGEAAMPAMVFAVATLFSDAIFAAKNNFPMLFLYGEGGSGKSTVVNFLQYLFGSPQPALKLSEKANTDKAKIRKLAQFANAIACMEEYINDLDLSVKKTLTGIYDRLGYERGTLDSKFGTETVPIQSTIIVTGNEYPDDDPLLQRLILIDYNHNTRTDEVVTSFDKLVQLNRQGITTVTGQILQHRDSIIANWDKVYRQEFVDLKAHYKGPVVPDRMIENNAVLLAVYKILQHAGREWPFKFEQLRDYLIKTLISQADKRDTGAVLQRFWDIVLSLLNKRLIKHGHEVSVNGNELRLRFKEVHMLYLEEHNKIYRMRGLASNTLLQKLKDSPAYKENRASVKSSEDGSVTSAYIFDYNKLHIDLLAVIDYQDKERSKQYQTKDYSVSSSNEQSQPVSTTQQTSLYDPDKLPF